MIVPQYSFLNRENDILDLPETISFLDDDEIGSGMVWIGDYDVCPCIGTHVASTKEIGSFHINSTSWAPLETGGGSFRIVFKTE